jgi:hypothetical protein
MVKRLIDNGADPTTYKNLALQNAIRHKNKELVTLLMKNLESDPDYK